MAPPSKRRQVKDFADTGDAAGPAFGRRDDRKQSRRGLWGKVVTALDAAVLPAQRVKAHDFGERRRPEKGEPQALPFRVSGGRGQTMTEEDRAAAGPARRPLWRSFLNAATVGGVALLALHAARVALGPAAQLRVLRLAAFVPARAWASVAPEWTAARFEAAARASPEAAQAAAFWFADGAWSASALTYAAVHAHWPHAISNAAMLALIGAPSALRLGAARFIALAIIGAAAGAAAQASAIDAAFAPLVGASACVCAASGALARLWTEPGAPLGRSGAASTRVAPLRQAFRRPRTLGALAAGLAATGLSAFAGDLMEPIGWRAHIGGFLAGFLVVGALARTKN